MIKKKLLITGNCGFIFSNFVRWIGRASQDYQIIGVDRVNGSTNNLYNNLYKNKNHSFYLADIRDQHIMDKIFQFEQPDLVIHGAAESNVDSSLTDPNAFVTSNVLGTQVMINCCLKNKVEKLVYASIDEVYGQLSNESDPLWKEESRPDPRNPYAASKAAGELLVRAAHQYYGLTYNITRSSNNYGPRQTPDKLIPKVIECILKDQKIPVYGQGLQIRDWTYVSDNCAAILKVLEKGKPNETYNVSANQELSNIEVIQRICNIMEKGHNLIEFVKDRPCHDFRYAIDSTKVRELGWVPATKLRDGLEYTVSWFSNNSWIFSQK
jgi:dTDP-glucose 4,6-dehydratase